MTADEFAAVAERIQAVWWSEAIPPGALQGYMSVLGEYSLQEVEVAVQSFVDEGGTFAPKAPELKMRIGELRLAAPSWEQLAQILRDYASITPSWIHDGKTIYGRREFLAVQHPLVRMFIQDNWQVISMTDPSDPTVQAQTRNKWQERVRRAVTNRERYELEVAALQELSGPRAIGGVSE